MRRKAKQLGIALEAIEFGPDHVHLFVTNCRKHSVSSLAFHFKGSSSYFLRKHAWDEIRHMLWGSSFWSDGYFYESVGRVTSDSIKYYIERQQGKHWKGIDNNDEEIVPIQHENQQPFLVDFMG
jgi:REP element-mobilizing transposase RayT